MNQKINLIDIGSSGGVNKIWKDKADVVLFDALENNALFSKAEEKSFYVTQNPACSSLYQPNFSELSRFGIEGDFKIVETRKVKTKKLDRVFDGDADFIKLDTQGSELDILVGAKKTIKNVLGIIVETEFFEHYKDQPLFGDIHKFMLENQFSLMEMKRSYWNGEIAWADCLYLTRKRDLISRKKGKAKIIANIFKQEEWVTGEKKKSIISWQKIRGTYFLSRVLLKIQKTILRNSRNNQLSEIEIGDQI